MATLVPIQHPVTGDRAAVAPDAVPVWQALGWVALGPYIPPVTFDPNVDAIAVGQTVKWNGSRFVAADLGGGSGASVDPVTGQYTLGSA